MNLLSLQSFIISMSRPEYRAFGKLMMLKNKEKNYITLFNYLLKTKMIDNGLLEKEYGQHGLEAARKHLTKALMKSARDCDGENSIENQLTDLLKDVQILHRKGFIKDCFQKLTKLKEMALKNELYAHFLTAAKLELRYLSRDRFWSITETELMEKHRLITDVLEHEMQLHRHSSLHQILSVRFTHKGLVNNQQEKVKLNDLLIEESSILNNRNYRSFESKKTHLNFQSIYFLMIGEHEESLKIFYELNDLFQANKALWISSPDYYISLLDGVLTDLYAMERYPEMIFFIEQLSSISSESEDMRVNLMVLTTYYNLCVLNQTGQYKKAKEAIKNNSSIINKLIKDPSSDLQAQLCLMISLVHFNNKEYKECGQLLNHALNAGDINITHQTYNMLKILYLMTQYELEHYDFITYQIRSFERRLNLSSHESELEKVTITMLKWLCLNGGFDVKHHALFVNKIIELEVSPQYRNFIQKVQIKKWVNDLAGRIKKN
jgi:hypothetical protein